jgi:hypothetical protein
MGIDSLDVTMPYGRAPPRGNPAAVAGTQQAIATVPFLTFC